MEESNKRAERGAPAAHLSRDRAGNVTPPGIVARTLPFCEEPRRSLFDGFEIEP